MWISAFHWPHFFPFLSIFVQSCSRSRIWTDVDPCRWKWCFRSVQRHEGGATQSGGWKPALPHWSHDLQVEFIHMNPLNIRNRISHKQPMWHSVDLEENTSVPLGVGPIFTVCRVANSAENTMRCTVNLFVNTIFCYVGFYEAAWNM